MTNIETPDGWERRGKFLFRQYGESFATIRSDPDGDWMVNVSHEQDTEQNWERAFDQAVAWANEQLGVPKPVEVVRTEYRDAWILTCEQTGRSWRVSKDVRCRDYVDVQAAIEMGEKYVRGDA